MPPGYPANMAAQRPNPFQWLRYTFGGRLPDRYRDWVLYDATSPTWLWRFAIRVVVESLPWLAVGAALFFLFTPLPAGWVFATLGLALGLSLYYTLTSADELIEARLVKHGFPAGTGKSQRRRSG